MTKLKPQPEKNGIDLDSLNLAQKPRILVIDDEPATVTLVKHIFLKEGFDVSGAAGGREAIERLPELNPSLILLDLMMPVMDGWETLRLIRQLTNVPVIVISAIGQKEKVVEALQMGADDYVTKPFDQAEVIARSQAVLRRFGPQTENERVALPGIQLILDLATQEALYKGKHIQLTGKMYEVLATLVHNAPHVVTYQSLNMKIWGQDSTLVRNRLKYLVYLLRGEFNAIDEGKQVIRNVDRLGYRLASED